MKDTTIQLSIFLLLLTFSFTVTAQNKTVDSGNATLQENRPTQKAVMSADEPTQNKALAPGGAIKTIEGQENAGKPDGNSSGGTIKENEKHKRLDAIDASGEGSKYNEIMESDNPEKKE